MPSIWLLANLLSLALAYKTLNCDYPIPPPSSIPSLQDCLSVVSGTLALSRREMNVPRTWSRYPRGALHVQLPASFSYADPSSNDCEFLVDVMEDRDVDIFPTYRIAEVAGDLVHYCLLAAGPETSTIGNGSIGPLELVRVALRKRQRLTRLAAEA